MHRRTEETYRVTVLAADVEEICLETSVSITDGQMLLKAIKNGYMQLPVARRGCCIKDRWGHSQSFNILRLVPPWPAVTNGGRRFDHQMCNWYRSTYRTLREHDRESLPFQTEIPLRPTDL